VLWALPVLRKDCISHARERRLWVPAEPAICSQFLTEIPEELLTSKSLQVVFLAIRQLGYKSGRGSHDAAERVSISESQNWTVGDRIVHKTFGVGEITRFLLRNKISLAIKFPSVKLLTPKLLARVG